MGDGLMLARLATMMGKPLAARYGRRRVTIASVGRKDGEPFVMATDKGGSVILGQPSDFSIPSKRVRRVK